MRRALASHITNSKGSKTNRKILVIESDDWGSIRMPSKKVYETLLKYNIKVDSNPYCRYDSLETASDLSELFEVLQKYKDSKGRHPVITANTVVANPDFEKIKDSGYQEYFYEPFTATQKRYGIYDAAKKMWNTGIDEGLFYPQFHGREHVNVHTWLKLLQQNNKAYCLAFENECFGLPNNIPSTGKINIQASYDTENKDELESQKQIIESGLKLFEDIFGHKSRSFIANNFIWHSDLEEVLAKNGVDFIQGMKFQKLPYFVSEKRAMIRHFVGEYNKWKQMYLVRNCVFEPSQNFHTVNEVGLCLKDISNAFLWKKPAIISTHRLNFIGGIDQSNRDKGLKSLGTLLKTVVSKWPDVEFMTSVELGDIIKNY